MALPVQTIRKLFRENFPGTAPIIVDPAEKGAVAADLKARLGRIDGVDPKENAWVRDEEKPKHVATFSISDPGAYYVYGSTQSFRLDLDAENRLTIRETHGRHAKDAVALVGDLDEVVRFVRECKRRFDRKKALSAQRGKIRNLTAQAIQAQVRKLARDGQFDFLVDTDGQKVNLYVKISEDRAVVFPIPYTGFEELLPRLKPAIAALRKLHEGGIYFRSITERKLPYRKAWTTYRSLVDSSSPSEEGEDRDDENDD